MEGGSRESSTSKAFNKLPSRWLERSSISPQTAISSINEDFKRGAIAVTIWTNSMTMFRNPSGKFVQSDDPKLEPIYKDMVTHHVPLISHTAMQDEEWVPEPRAIAGDKAGSSCGQRSHS